MKSEVKLKFWQKVNIFLAKLPDLRLVKNLRKISLKKWNAEFERGWSKICNPKIQWVIDIIPISPEEKQLQIFKYLEGITLGKWEILSLYQLKKLIELCDSLDKKTVLGTIYEIWKFKSINLCNQNQEIAFIINEFDNLEDSAQEEAIELIKNSMVKADEGRKLDIFFMASYNNRIIREIKHFF